MKQKWSAKWKSSIQPRKQRKFRINAPMHVRHRFMAAHLSPDLRRQFGKRSIPVRKGDDIRVMKGGSKGTTGTVERVDLKKLKVYVGGINIKKVDGSEVLIALEPSNLMITKLNLDDKMRQRVFDRVVKKPEKKPEPKKMKEADKKKGLKDGMKGKQLKGGLKKGTKDGLK
jgi:large subunit ribosomal protein L24